MERNRTTYRKHVLVHYKLIYRGAYRYAGTREMAEDLTQDTFATAYDKFHQLRELSNAKAWLFTILRNKFFTTLRKKEDALLDEPHMNLDTIEQLVDNWCPEKDYIANSDKEMLQESINELPEKFKAPLVLSVINELSYEEVSKTLEIPIGTVMSRISRAKSYLKKFFLKKANYQKNNLRLLRRSS